MRRLIDLKNFFLFKLAGVPVFLNPTWFVIFLLITLSVYFTGFLGFYPQGFEAVWLLQSLVFSLIFFFCLISHELAHSIVALRNGIEVEGIVLHLFGGTAKILREPLSPFQEVKMAAAGPIVSVLFSSVFYLLSNFFRNLAPPASVVFYLLSIANLGVAIFNLLPAFPLDGGRLLRAFLWFIFKKRIKATRYASYVSSSIAVLLFLVGVFLGMNFGPDGLWISVLAIIIFNLNRESILAAYQDELMNKRLSEIINFEALREMGQVYFYDLDYPSIVEFRPESTVYEVLKVAKTQRPLFVKIKTNDGDFYLSAQVFLNSIFSILERAKDIIK